MSTYAAPRGMRDFYPEDYRLREALFQAWRKAANLYGFEFYDSPVVETMELLERKAGEEISEQIYAFEDKSGRRLALRAELTPSLARMIIGRQNTLSFPVKWAAIGQCFRYERMTRGRKREHYQWNLDVIGEESVMAEAEVIAAAITALRQMGIDSTDFKVQIGSRAILAELFAKSGLPPEHFQASCLALDKRGKISDDEIRQLLATEGLAPDAITRVFDLLAIHTLEQLAAQLDPESKALSDLRELFAIAEALHVAEFLTFNLGVIRGLGYYTGIVFEAFDTAGKFRAIFGGGRYDNLLSSLGGERMPCVGLGFGDIVIAELLAECGKTPATHRSIEYAIGFMDLTARPLALKVSTALREAGQTCDLALSPEKPKKFFGRADKSGANYAIYIGPDEVASGRLLIKSLRGATSLEIRWDELLKAPIPPL